MQLQSKNTHCIHEQEETEKHFFSVQFDALRVYNYLIANFLIKDIEKYKYVLGSFVKK